METTSTRWTWLKPAVEVDFSCFGSEFVLERTEEEFRKEVDAYLLKLRDVARRPDMVIRKLASDFLVVVTNTSDEPLEDLTINLHIEGPIHAIGDAPGKLARTSIPQAPRAWGPQ